MTRNKKSVRAEDMKGVLSTLWIFLTVNYIYCDHLGLMEPGNIEDLLAGQIGSVPVTSEFLLAAALLMQIPFAMIVLSRVLPYRVNRWANMIAAVIMIAVQIGTMGMGTAPSPVYIFYSTIEIACNLVIAGLAWKWRYPEVSPDNTTLKAVELGGKA